MAFVLKDRVRETSTTTSTTDFALSATSDYQRFGTVMANADTTLYCAVLGSAWETGIGTWVTGHTLQRTTILESSNAGAKVSFGAGVKDIFMDIPASRVAVIDRDNSFLGKVAAALGYWIGSVPVIDVAGAYIALQGNAALTARILLGYAGDPNNYHDATAHVFRDGSGATNRFRVDTNGVQILAGFLATLASTTARPSLRVPAGVAPTSPVDGDIWNDGSAGKIRIGSTTYSFTPGTGLTAANAVDYATKAEQETATSAVKTVSPARQQDHPSAAKAWVSFDATGAATASYNATSARTGNGTYTVTFPVPFSSVNYAAVVTARQTSYINGLIGVIAGKTASVLSLASVNLTPASNDSQGMDVVCFGDQ